MTITDPRIGDMAAQADAYTSNVLYRDLRRTYPVVVRATRQAHPRCVTILLTGYRASETAVEAIHHQADDYIAKPTDIDALVDAPCVAHSLSLPLRAFRPLRRTQPFATGRLPRHHR